VLVVDTDVEVVLVAPVEAGEPVASVVVLLVVVTTVDEVSVLVVDAEVLLVLVVDETRRSCRWCRFRS